MGGDWAGRWLALVLVAIAAWILVYWLWEPSPPPISHDDSPPVTFDESAGLIGPSEPMEIVEPADLEQGAASPPPDTDDGAPITGVIPPEFGEYIVQEGDTGWQRIAERIYGDSKLWQVVSKANPLVSPTKLKPGVTVLRYPLDPNNVQGIPIEEDGAEPEPVKPPEPIRYTVTRNDTLSGISKMFYGAATKWRVIYDANRDVIDDPDRLREGSEIIIPPLGEGG